MSVQESKRAAKPRRRAVAKSGDSHARAAQREEQIATAAYFRAQKRGFEPGHELDDWLAAEAEVTSSESAMVTSKGGSTS